MAAHQPRIKMHKSNTLLFRHEIPKQPRCAPHNNGWKNQRQQGNQNGPNRCHAPHASKTILNANINPIFHEQTLGRNMLHAPHPAHERRFQKTRLRAYMTNSHSRAHNLDAEGKFGSRREIWIPGHHREFNAWKLPFWAMGIFLWPPKIRGKSQSGPWQFSMARIENSIRGNCHFGPLRIFCGPRRSVETHNLGHGNFPWPA